MAIVIPSDAGTAAVYEGEELGEGELADIVTTRSEEPVAMHGRQFVVLIEGPLDAGRYEAFIHELPDGRPLTRAPIRGRNPSEARERALEVMHVMLTLQGLHEAIIGLAAELAPGATVELTEDANAIRAELTGGWYLGAPLTIPRDDLANPDLSMDALQARIRAHFTAHLRPVSG